MVFIFDEISKVKIIERFGEIFYTRVNGIINRYIVRWSVIELDLIDSFSANLVFAGRSSMYGKIIIKFGINSSEFSSEVEALRQFTSESVCKIYDVDLENMVLLEEGISPGTLLKDEEDIEVRLEVFCELYKQLHFDEYNPTEEVDLSNKEHAYKSYEDWIFRITDFMEKETVWSEVTSHMKRAKNLFVELSKRYPAARLLHGDFHYYNILQSDFGYKIIDPKGVIGNPIFDIPRYIINEFWDEEDDSAVDAVMNQVINYMSQRLKISEAVIRKLVYIEGTLAMCWNIEDGISTNNKADILKTLNKLYKYLD